MSEPAGFELSKQQRELLGDEVATGPLRNRVEVPLPPGTDLAGVALALGRAAGEWETLRTTFHQPAGLRHPLQMVGTGTEGAVKVTGAGVGTGADVGDGGPPEVVLDPAHGPVVAARLDGRGGQPVLVLEGLAAVADIETLEMLGARVAAAPGGRDGTAGDAVEEPLGYADYQAWQAGLDDDGSEEAKEAAAYAAGLRGLPATELALLPAPAPLPPVEVPVELNAVVAAGLDELARAAGGNLSDAWLALWASAIAQVSGEAKVVLGEDFDTRQTSEELAGAPGPYRRVVPVVIEAAAAPTFPALVDQVVQARARAHRLAHRLPVPAADDRSAARLPTLLYSSVPDGAEAGRRPFQLELRVSPSGRARVLAGALATGSDAAGAAGWLSTLASGVTSAPGERPAETGLVSAGQAAPLLALGAGPTTATAADGIATRIAQWAAKTPDAEAVFDGSAGVTYAQLLSEADRLAAHLLQAGPLTAPVALFLERSTGAVTAMLGVLRAGGAYLPLATDQPAARVAALLADAGSQVVVTTDALAAELPAFDGTVVTLEAARKPEGAQPATGLASPPVPVTPGAPAYVLYTSGSTGAPKGVEVPQVALGNYTDAILGLLGPSARPRRFALVSSLATDLGNNCLFPGLVSGGVVDIVPADVAADPAAFAAWGRRRPIDVLKVTPSHLNALLAAEDPGVLPAEVLVLGGEASTWALVDRVAKLSGCRVLNHYGPTETTVGTLVYDLAEAARHRSRPAVPIGRSLPNTEALILGPDLGLVPRGAIGELCVGGLGLARGYINDPARTAERFVAHPWRAGARLYRTGDRARMLSDGTVEFLGREDGQVKVRGFRVECGEVEEALRKHRQVQRAAVVLREDEPGQPRLVGYFVSHFHPSPDQGELRRHLAERLPEHMVPVAFVELDSLPLTPSGKLDRSALPAPELAPTRVYEAPRTPTEQTLADIFAELLALDRVGIHDDFFELGGHSLLATQVVVRARAAFGTNLPVHALFLRPTVASLAEEVDEERAASGPADGDMGDMGDMEAMMEAIAALSDEEAAALLAAQKDDSEP